MKVLVTGSSGHLGEALVRLLRDLGHDVNGLDIKSSPYTSRVGSITDRDCVRSCMQGVEAVLHAATLHKPHIATHSRQAFVDTNITADFRSELARAVGSKGYHAGRFAGAIYPVA